MIMPSVLRTVVLGARPKTLLVSIMPIIFAGVATRANPLWVASALLAAVFIQVGTNLVNDVADFERGADTEDRIGPRRVTQSGLCTAREVWASAGFCFLASVVGAIPLIQEGGWPLLAVGLISIACGVAYTAGPAPLAYRGMGELFVFLFFGPVSVLTLSVLFRSGNLHAGDVLASLQVGCLAVVILGINNLRDQEGDARAGKRTLAVRWGAEKYRRFLTVVLLAPFAIGVGWLWWESAVLVSVLPVVVLPLARSIQRILPMRNSGAEWNALLARSALLHALFIAALTIGVWFEL